MEMDMEMPDPEELEWMESHGLLPEEEEDVYFDDPDEAFVPPPGDSDKPRDSSQPPEPAAPRASMQHSPSLYTATLALHCFDCDGIYQMHVKVKLRKAG